MFKKRNVKGSKNQKVSKRLRLKLDESCDEVKNLGIKEESKPLKDTKLDELQAVGGHSSGDAAKYVLSVNDDAVKEDVLNAEAARDQVISNDTSTVLTSKKLTGSSKKIHQPVNIRTTLLMDYQPDVCKDFKQTGYCGYGDSCKFLHSRDDFKTGWKLDQNWKFDDDNSGSSSKLENELKDIPFKCVICKNDYKKPVVTSCEHYFCSSCFTSACKKTTKCFICGKETNGAVKIASKLRNVLEDNARD